MFFASKLNKLRTIALTLVFLGIGVMYLGFLLPQMMEAFFVLGVLVMCSCAGVYFWAGILSSQAVKVECPDCGKVTKILGKMDKCMFCKTALSLDPRHAPNHENNP